MNRSEVIKRIFETTDAVEICNTLSGYVVAFPTHHIDDTNLDAEVVEQATNGDFTLTWAVVNTSTFDTFKAKYGSVERSQAVGGSQ